MADEAPVEVKHKIFSNGDVYLGGWRAGLVSSAQQEPVQSPQRRRTGAHSSRRALDRLAASRLSRPRPRAAPQPEGDGKYTGKDGSWYEGGWKVRGGAPAAACVAGWLAGWRALAGAGGPVRQHLAPAARIRRPCRARAIALLQQAG